MKKHLMVTTATGAVMALTAPASAGSYATIFGGWSKMDDHSLTLGTKMSSGSWSWSNTWWNTWNANKQLIDAQPALSPSDTAFIVWKYTKTGSRYDSFSSWNWFESTSVDFDIDNGFVIGAAFGWELDKCKCISLEAEFAYRKHDVNADVMYYDQWSGYRHWTRTKLLFTSFYESVIHAVTGPFQGTLLTRINLTSNVIPGTRTKSATNTWDNTKMWTDSYSGELTSWSIMANVWWDLNHSGTWHPYVGGGIGFADVDLDLGSIVASDDGFAWQAAAGLGFDIDADTRLNLEYRYFTVPDLSLTYMGDDLGIEYDVQEIIIGLRMRF